MNEKIINQFEQKAEHIPTPEEVSEVLRQMVKGEYHETNRYVDEQGNVYRIDAIAQGTEEGESIELYYRRKVYADSSQDTEVDIHSTHVKNGSCGPAGPQASFINGKWVLMD
jgi:hypothetical protein